MVEEIQIDEVMSMESADGLVKLYDEMIVPHFQRGLVWDDSSISLLLESLYFGTPCGSIILWTPRDALEQGKPLGSRPRYVIVDGQQRVRTLWNCFRGEEEKGTNLDLYDDEGGSETLNGSTGEREEGVWCFNLGRAREFEREFPGGKRFRLFRRAKDPRKSEKDLRGAPRQDRQALLPLRWFLQHTDGKISALVRTGEDKPVEKAVSALLENFAVKKRLRSMFTRPLFSVYRLNADYSLEDVIGIYNRINSAGKKVESEEKAFANLVSICPEASEKLREFFVAIHGSTDRSRDRVLQRQKENLFGFKLFMRTFVQVLAYHTGRSLGSASFSFDSINPEAVREAKRHLPRMLDDTKGILVCLAGVLREELNCDDFRLLPETSSLWPVIQLLIRFPDLLHRGRKIAGPSLAIWSETTG